jgi:hypothetical protein
MLSFKERLEFLEADLQKDPPGFIMTADLPFAVFRYDPMVEEEDEWKIRRQVSLLATRVQNKTGKMVHLLSLSELFWKSVQESEGVDALVELEQERGFQVAEEQANHYLTDPDWKPLDKLLVDQASTLAPEKNILFYYRAGVFAPSAYRISALLERLMGRVKVPAVLFYPGSWKGSLNYMSLHTGEEALGSYRVKIYGRDT